MRLNIIFIGLRFASPRIRSWFLVPLRFRFPRPDIISESVAFGALSLVRSFGRSHKDFDHYRRFLQNLAPTKAERELGLN